MRRLGKAILYISFSELAFLLCDLDPDPLPRKGMFHENNQTVHPGQGFPSEGQLFNIEVNFHSLANIAHSFVTTLLV